MKEIVTREEFLKELRRLLTLKNVTDPEDILLDFEQHFEFGLEKGKTEAEVCRGLGAPSEIAAQYESKKTGNDSQKKNTPPPKTENPVNPLTLEEIIVVPVPEEPSALKLEAQDIGHQMEEIIKSAPQYEPPPVNEKNHDGEGGTEGNSDGFFTGAGDNAKSFFSGFGNNTKEFLSGLGEKSETGGKDFSVSGLILCLIMDLLVLSWVIPALFSVLVSIFTASVSAVFTGIGTVFGGILKMFEFTFFPFGGIAGCFGGIALFSLGVLGILLSIKFGGWFLRLMKLIINWHGKRILGRVIFENKDERDYREVGA